MGKSYPSPPNPTVVANAQTGSNLATATANAELNRVTQNTPYGSSNWSVIGTNPDGTPQYQQDVSLSAPEQTLFNLGTQNQAGLAQSAQNMIGQVQGSYANPISTAGAPGIASNVSTPLPVTGQIAPTTAQMSGGVAPTGATGTVAQPGIGINNGQAQTGLNTAGLPGLTTSIANSGPGAISQAQDAAYKSQAQYLDPQFAQGKEALDNQLANQGIVPGSEAYKNAQDNFARQKQAAYQSAQNAAVQAGNQEQNVLFGQGLSQAQLQNAAQGQGFGQALAGGQFYNQGAGQNFGQSLAGNAQQFGQGLSQAELANQAAQQQYGQGVTSAELQNATQGQQFGQNATQAGFGNQAQQQQFGQGGFNAQLQNQAQQQFLQQLFALRNQPLNEYNALATGSQVQQPSFGQVPNSTMNPTNVAGIYQNNFQNQMSIAQQQGAFLNNLMGLGGMLGGAAILA